MKRTTVLMNRLGEASQRAGFDVLDTAMQLVRDRDSDVLRGLDPRVGLVVLQVGRQLATARARRGGPWPTDPAEIRQWCEEGCDVWLQDFGDAWSLLTGTALEADMRLLSWVTNLEVRAVASLADIDLSDEFA